MYAVKLNGRRGKGLRGRDLSEAVRQRVKKYFTAPGRDASLSTQTTLYKEWIVVPDAARGGLELVLDNFGVRILDCGYVQSQEDLDRRSATKRPSSPPLHKYSFP